MVPRCGIDFIHGGPEPHGTVPNGLFWCVHATAFEAEQNLTPALCRLAHPIFDCQQPFLTTSRHTNNHKGAKLVVFASKADVNTISPDVDQGFIVRCFFSPAVVFLSPFAHEPRHGIGR